MAEYLGVDMAELIGYRLRRPSQVQRQTFNEVSIFTRSLSELTFLMFFRKS